MKITIESGVFKKYPKFMTGFVLVREIDNLAHLAQARHLLSDVKDLVKLAFNKPNLQNHHLVKPEAVARAEFGKNAKHYSTSVERLMLKVQKGKKVVAKDCLNNLISYIALKNIIPFAVDDVDKLDGSLHFALSGKQGSRKLKPGALYYRDDKRVLGRKFDFWKNQKTKVTAKTRSALIHFEVLPPISRAQLNKVLKEMAGLVRVFCGGRTRQFILAKSKNSIKV